MDDLWVRHDLIIPAGDLDWDAVRGSGPGGQNVNKVSSKVELRFFLSRSTVLPEPVRERLLRLAANRVDRDGNILLTSQKTRDQHRNLEDAQARLRDLILQALVEPRPRRPTKPSRSAKEQRLGEKRQLATKKKLRRREPHDGGE